MKNSTTVQRPTTIKQATARPENKDSLDSRKNEEQDDKGANTTHNSKETKKEHLKTK